MNQWLDYFLQGSFDENLIKVAAPFLSLLVLKLIFRKKLQLNLSYIIPVSIVIFYSPYLKLGCVCVDFLDALAGYGVLFFSASAMLLLLWWLVCYVWRKFVFT